jgi:hypothetical protein
MMVVLIPLLVWTLVGLIALWPRDVASHVNTNNATVNIPGDSYPTGRITAIATMSCEGMAGSTPAEETGTCANLAVEVWERRDGAVSSGAAHGRDSSIRVGQVVKLISVRRRRVTGHLPVRRLRASSPAAGDHRPVRRGGDPLARWRSLASLIGLGFTGFILGSQVSCLDQRV